MSSGKEPNTPIKDYCINYGATDMIDTTTKEVENQTDNLSTTENKTILDGNNHQKVINTSEPPKPAVRLKIRRMSSKTAPNEYQNDAFEKDPTPVAEKALASKEEVAATGSQLEMADTSGQVNISTAPIHEIETQLLATIPTNKCTSALPLPTELLPPVQRSYPLKVLFIIANEFCERFSYYGLRTVMVLYFKDVLGFSNKNATVSYHLFAMLCYVMPIFGAVLGDSIWGKYKTILYLSIVYLCGEIILVMSSVFWDLGAISVLQAMVGLFFIGVGTGGIKPCVLSFGGDQFFPHETQRREKFFSLFYAAINLGSLISMFLTPLFRSQFKCVNRTDCYPLAFGLPCLLMFLSIVIFVMARTRYHKAPLPERNVIVAFFHCTFLALSRKVRGLKPQPCRSKDDELPVKGYPPPSNTSSSTNVSIDSSNEGSDKAVIKRQDTASSLNNRRREVSDKAGHMMSYTTETSDCSHWLYLALDRYDAKSIEEFRSVLNLMLLCLPLPVYWCLYEQQGSVWTLQAVRMDGKVFNTGFTLQPDQMGVANPVLLLLMIPVCEFVIYPMAKKCNLLTTSVQRMTVGGLLVSLAFLSSAMIEHRMEGFMPKQTPDPGRINLLVVNGLNDCSISNLTLSSPELISNANTITNNSNQSLTETKIDQLPPLTTKNLNLLMTDPSLQGLNETFTSSYRLKFSPTSLIQQPTSIPASQQTNGCPFSPGAEYELIVQLPVKEVSKILYIEQGNGKLDYKLLDDSLELPQASQARVRLLYEFFGSYSQAQKNQFSLVRRSTGSGSTLKFQPVERFGQVILSAYITIETTSQGELFDLVMANDQLSISNLTYIQRGLFIKPGTRNMILVHQKDASNFESKLELLQDNDYRISMLFHLIPYWIVALSEVMFSITATAFCYSMAPETMKSVILALYLLTVAAGNLLTVLVEAIHLFSNPAHDLLFYAALLAVDMFIFALLGSKFKPKQINTS